MCGKDHTRILNEPRTYQVRLTTPNINKLISHLTTEHDTVEIQEVAIIQENGEKTII